MTKLGDASTERPFRQMSGYERAVLDRLLAVQFDGAEAARLQAQTALVRPLDDDGCLEFQVREPASLPWSDGSRMLSHAAGPTDAAGVPVLIQLSSSKGRLQWLEFIRFDGDPDFFPPPEAWTIEPWPAS